MTNEETTSEMPISDNKLICTMCGNELDDCDIDANFHFQHYIGFGSKYDMSLFEARLCCRCYDKILDKILPMFKNNPLWDCEIVNENGMLITKVIEEHE